MLLWLNGTFGVGKTTRAREIVERAPGRRFFDPEWVGYMLRANLSDQQFDDFQELRPWRALVPRVADEIGRLTGEELVAVQTVLVEDFWLELRSGFDELELDVFHVVLDIEEAALRERIAGDTVEDTAKDWRLSHIETFHAARAWMTAEADLVVDVTERGPRDAANSILNAMGGQP
jgi:AAA domain